MSASRPSGGLGQLRLKNTFIELARNNSNTDSETEELEQSAAAETSEKAAPEASKSEDSPLQRILTDDCLLPLKRTVSIDSLDGENLDGLCMGETKKDSRLGNVAPAGLTSSSSASAGNAGVEGSPVNYFMDFPVRNSFLEIPAPRADFFKEREVRSAPGRLSDRWSSRGSESGAEEEAAALAAAADAAEPKEQRQFRCAECGDPAAEFGQFDWSDGRWRCKACWVKLCSEGPVDQRPAGSQSIQHFIIPADGSGAGVPFGMPTNPMDGYACLPMAPVQSNVGAYPLMLVSCVPGVPGQWGQQQQPVVPSVMMGSQVVAEADAARPPRNPHWADLFGDEGGAPAWEVVTPPASWADLSGHQQPGAEAEPTLRPRYDLEWKKHDDGEAGRHPEEDEERHPHQYRSQYRFQYQQNGQKVRDSGRRDAARGGNVPQTAAAKCEQKWQPKWQPKGQQKWQPKWQPKGQQKWQQNWQQNWQQVVKSEVLPPEVLAPKVLKPEAAEKPAVYESEAKKPAAAAPAVDNLNREEPAVDAPVAQKLAAEGKPEINGPEEAKVNTCHWCSGDGKQYGAICCYCVSEKDRARLDEIECNLKKVLACCGGMGPTAKHLAQESLERCSSRVKDMPEDSSKDRLSEALGQFGLDEHAEAIRGLSLGVDSLESLLRLSGDDMERVHNLLEDSGADKQGRRGFRKWLQVPPQGRAGVAPALEPAAGPLDDDDDDEGDEGDEDADGSGEAPGGDDPCRGCNAGKLKERAYFKTDDDARNADAKTVMLRNIPNDYTVGSLMALLQQHDIAYDFLYQPRDWKPERHGSSLGFAFVNCVSHEEAVKCKALNNFKDWNILGSSKVMHVCWGEPRFQGLEKNIERYRNSPVMHPDIRDDWKPMIFKSGQRVAFPAPTKAIRRPRNPRAKGANH